MFIIDEKERKIIITNNVSRNIIEIRENEELNRKFLDGTQDKYKCILKLIEVDILDISTHEKTGKTELKAFAQRKDNPSWIMEFIEDEYILA